MGVVSLQIEMDYILYLDTADDTLLNANDSILVNGFYNKKHIIPNYIFAKLGASIN